MSHSGTDNNKNMKQINHGRLVLIIILTVLVAAGIAAAGSQAGAVVNIAGFNTPVIVICAVLSFGINWLIFLPSWLAQTEHFFDLTGSLCFITLALTALNLSPDQDFRAIILTMMVCIWAARLGSFLFLRIRKDGSDGRFDAIKPVFTRFMVTWSIQALWVFVTSAAALTAISSTNREALNSIAYVGITLWALGFLIEIIADRQKRSFRADPSNEGRFIDSGLWAWSRHPNYFGEILLWLGVAVVAAPVLVGWQLVSLISPVFVVLLLTRVSGIPLLEARSDKRWGDDAHYQRYKETTPVLIPRPPRASH
jgi:steroid 5-alpha reductase family enzyme